MRTLTILALSALFTTAEAQRTKILNPAIDSLFPAAPNGYVVDQARMLSNPAKLEGMLRGIRQTDKLNMTVVTLPTTGRYQPSEVSLEIGRKWTVAIANDTLGAATRNTGIVILLVKDSRQCRIETATGSEGYLTDGMAGDLCREARPWFRSGDFDGGVMHMVNGITEKHRAELAAFTSPVTNVPSDSSGIWWVIGIVFAIIIVVAIIFYLAEKRNMRYAQEEAKRAARYRRDNPTPPRPRPTPTWDTMSANSRQDVLRADAERREAERKAKRRQKAEEDRYTPPVVISTNDDDDSRRRSSNDYSSWSSDSSSSSVSDSGGSDSFSGGGGGDSW